MWPTDMLFADLGPFSVWFFIHCFCALHFGLLFLIYSQNCRMLTSISWYADHTLESHCDSCFLLVFIPPLQSIILSPTRSLSELSINRHAPYLICMFFLLYGGCQIKM